jgi:hypothetical protein
VIERRPIRERGDDGIDVPSHLFARAMRYGLREPASAARAHDARQACGTDGAKAAVRGETASRAAFGEQSVENPVNHDLPQAVDSARRRL